MGCGGRLRVTTPLVRLQPRRDQTSRISADFFSAISLTFASYLLGQRLDLFLAGLQVVLGEDLVGLLLVGLLVGVAADVADRDAGFLGQVLDAADQLLALLDGERRGR